MIFCSVHVKGGCPEPPDSCLLWFGCKEKITESVTWTIEPKVKHLEFYSNRQSSEKLDQRCQSHVSRRKSLPLVSGKKHDTGQIPKSPKQCKAEAKSERDSYEQTWGSNFKIFGQDDRWKQKLHHPSECLSDSERRTTGFLTFSGRLRVSFVTFGVAKRTHILFCLLLAVVSWRLQIEHIFCFWVVDNQGQKFSAAAFALVCCLGNKWLKPSGVGWVHSGTKCRNIIWRNVFPLSLGMWLGGRLKDNFPSLFSLVLLHI